MTDNSSIENKTFTTSLSLNTHHMNHDEKYIEDKDYPFKQPPSLNSAGLYDLVTTPPSQHVATFNGSDNGPETNYDKIHNLPTPIIANRGIENSEPMKFSMKSPVSPLDRVFVNNESTLSIPKMRTKKPQILAESNRTRRLSDVMGDINNEKDDVLSELPKQRVNSSISSMAFMKNLKPVDRVVSLPLPPPNTKDVNKFKVPLTKIETREKPDEHGFSHPLHLTTNSLDETHRPQKWQVQYEIGSGSFSKVYLAQTGDVALKVTDVSYSKDGQESEELRLRIQNSLTREIEILKTLNHPNIIHLIGTDYTTKSNGGNIERLTMALEYCKGGDLYSFILEKGDLITCELIQCIFANIVSAVNHLHSKNICHRDIKLENVLLKYSHLEMIENGVNLVKSGLPIVVLSDFGLSKKIDESNPLISTRCGSEDYVSPELLLGMPYDGKQNDCWSLGVVLYTMLEGRLPFDPLPSELKKLSSRNAKPSHRIVMILWSWFKIKDDPDMIYSAPKKIVKMLLAKRNKRATIEDILNTEWVSEVSVNL